MQVNQNWRDVTVARFLSDDAGECVLNKLQTRLVQCRCSSKEGVAVVETWTDYCRGDCFCSISGKRGSNVTKSADMKVWSPTYLRNMFIERHFGVEVNAQAFYWWLKLDRRASDRYWFYWVGQGCKGFWPWVEKGNGFRFRWNWDEDHCARASHLPWWYKIQV